MVTRTGVPIKCGRLTSTPHGGYPAHVTGNSPANVNNHRISETDMGIRRILGGAVLFLAVMLCSCASGGDAQPAARIDIYFSPRGGCTDAIIGQLDGAGETVLVQAYSFTSAPIAKALADAHKRGVKVQAILDKSQRTARYTSATFLKNAGIPVFIDAKHAIAHNKVMVVDGRVVITGSFNFSKAAEQSNAENLLVIDSPEIARKYTENWREHLAHSVPYEREEKG